MRELQLAKPFRGFPKGYRFNDEEAKEDKEKKVFVLPLSGPTIAGGNTVEIPADIVEDYGS